jgi:preprotein translocase subunit SecA
MRGGKSADEATLAAVRDAIRRHLTVPGTDRPLEPYPEQIASARALLRGAVIEMATGEGKTITAAFAAACWARHGPVHIATANEYLAGRDAGLLAPVYADLGLTTGVVTAALGPAERRRQYARDIVYSTLAELGFEYLRDRLVTRPADRVQRRGLGALIVDEADLLLIDEARTPLIIARPATDTPGPDLPALARLVAALVAEQWQRVTDKLARIGRATGWEAAVLAAQIRRGAPRDPEVLAHFSARRGAMAAAERAERELRGADVWMLDDGLLYAVDERARTAYLTEEGQRRVEERLGPVFARPTESGTTLAALHSLLLAFTLFERDRDYLVRDGRVVLIEEATGRAAESRRYMHGLHAAIEVKELGGPNEDTETLAQISVQQFVRLYARRAGMTGTARPAAEEFARIYEMPVVPIPRHRRSRRVDLPPRLYRTAAAVDRAVVEEVRAAHAAGRPVLVGTQDVGRSERLSRLLTAAGLPHAVLNAREHAREAEIVAEAGRPGAITVATTMAGRGTDIRLKGPLGLYVIGVEPAANRRLDDQLRGRSGRQGDEGLTRLYASLEDETLRFYGAAHVRAAAVRALVRRPFLEGRAARRVIDDAQRRADRLHYGQRRTLFALDRVLEAQRRAMLAAYERALVHPAPTEAVRGFIGAVAADEIARRPDAPAERAAWAAELAGRYGLPAEGPENRERGTGWAENAAALAAALADRFARTRAEAGASWDALARTALLRAAAELWALHVEAIDALQRQAPVTFAFLPAPIVVSFAKEASARYNEYLRAVRAEALSALLTLPMPYERPLSPADGVPLSAAARELLGAAAPDPRHAPPANGCGDPPRGARTPRRARGSSS